MPADARAVTREPADAQAVAQEPADRRATVAVFDLDGTLMRGDTYRRYLLGYMQRQPRLFLRLPLLGGFWLAHVLGLRGNAWLKQRFLTTIMGGATPAEIEPWTDRFLARAMRSGLRPRALETLRRHKSAGHTLVLATASFDFYVDRLGQMLGFDQVVCTRAAWEAGNLAGTIDGANCHGEEKVRRLNAHFGAQRGGCRVLAYTDHHSDLPLLQWADEPVAVNPTRRLAALARRLGMPIQDWG